MCESTVKVHVRNLMKKMKAKNWTDLAIKAQIAHSCQRVDGGLEPLAPWRPAVRVQPYMAGADAHRQ